MNPSPSTVTVPPSPPLPAFPPLQQTEFPPFPPFPPWLSAEIPWDSTPSVEISPRLSTTTSPPAVPGEPAPPARRSYHGLLGPFAPFGPTLETLMPAASLPIVEMIHSPPVNSARR